MKTSGVTDQEKCLKVREDVHSTNLLTMYNVSK